MRINSFSTKQKTSVSSVSSKQNIRSNRVDLNKVSVGYESDDGFDDISNLNRLHQIKVDKEYADSKIESFSFSKSESQKFFKEQSSVCVSQNLNDSDEDKSVPTPNIQELKNLREKIKNEKDSAFSALLTDDLRRAQSKIINQIKNGQSETIVDDKSSSASNDSEGSSNWLNRKIKNGLGGKKDLNEVFKKKSELNKDLLKRVIKEHSTPAIKKIREFQSNLKAHSFLLNSKPQLSVLDLVVQELKEEEFKEQVTIASKQEIQEDYKFYQSHVAYLKSKLHKYITQYQENEERIIKLKSIKDGESVTVIDNFYLSD